MAADEEGYNAPSARDTALSLDAWLSTRVVGERLGVGSTRVRDTINHLRLSGREWPFSDGVTDAELEAKLYGVPGVKPGRRKYVTLQVSWEEYNAANSDGFAIRMGHASGIPPSGYRR